MGTPGPGCLRIPVPESMLVPLGAHACFCFQHARQRRPREANQRYREKLIFPARVLPVVAPAAVGQGAVAAYSLHRCPGLGLGLHGRRLRGARCSLSRGGPGWGAGGGLYHSPPGGDPPLCLRQWLGREGCGDPDPRGPLPCASVPRGRGCGNRTAYLFISDVCSTLPWQPLHLFRRR